MKSQPADNLGVVFINRERDKAIVLTKSRADAHTLVDSLAQPQPKLCMFNGKGSMIGLYQMATGHSFFCRGSFLFKECFFGPYCPPSLSIYDRALSHLLVLVFGRPHDWQMKTRRGMAGREIQVPGLVRQRPPLSPTTPWISRRPLCICFFYYSCIFCKDLL